MTTNTDSTDDTIYLYYDPGVQDWASTTDEDWVESAMERHGLRVYRVDEMTEIEPGNRFSPAENDS